MLLYKYRPASPLERILDISLNERLYCAPYPELNDPFEGQFLAIVRSMSGLSLEAIAAWSTVASGIGDPYQLQPPILSGEETVSKKPTTLNLPSIDTASVCSLSASADDVRMWSLYAEGHKGVAFEIDVAGMEPAPCKVNYHPTLREWEGHSLPPAHEVLTRKTSQWEYEKEYRVLTKQKHVSVVGRIRRVLVGPRASDLLASVLARTVREGVKIVRTRLDHEGVRIVPAAPLT